MSIYISYHYPCMDGAFSALIAYFALKSYFKNHEQKDPNLIIQDLQNKIIETIESQKQNSIFFQSLNKNQQQQQQEEEKDVKDSKIEQELEQNQNCDNNIAQEQKPNENQENISQNLINQQEDIDFFDDEKKPYFYSDSEAYIRYIPYSHQLQGQSKQSQNEQVSKKIKKQQKQQQKQLINSNQLLSKIQQIEKTQNLKNSILFMLDYSLPANNLEILSQKFQQIIILDHHIHFTDTIDDLLSNEKYQNLKNILYLYEEQLSGCTMTLKFFKQLTNFQNIMPKNIYEKINQMSIYIQDYDIKSKQNENSEAFVAGLYTYNLQLNAKQNLMLFYNFLSVSIDLTIQKGKQKIQEVKESVDGLVKKHKQVVYLGGKTKPIAKFYVVNNKDHHLINTLATELALKSLEDGMVNVGGVYNDNQNKQHFKVSLRAAQNDIGICNELAQKFGGGGHQRASSFFISKKQFQQWLEY